MLPLVGSTMVAPGLSLPSRSAVSIMFRQMRSLTDPPGLNDSILAHTSASFLPGRASEFNHGSGADQIQDGSGTIQTCHGVLVFLVGTCNSN